MITKPKVLIADDERVIRNVLYYLLHKDFDVVLAENLVQVIQYVRTPDAFDVILLDVHMPGPPLTQILDLLREKQPLCEVILVTGDVYSPVLREALAMGDYIYLQKPFNRDQVYALIWEGIEKRRAFQESAKRSVGEA